MTETFILAVDVEATCDDKGSVPRQDMEIIEIGAVLLDKDLVIIDAFQTFIRPFKNPILTPFCKELTSIAQEDVDDAPPVYEAFKSLGAWLQNHQPLTWYSWGDYDYKQFNLDCRRSGAPWPFPGQHVNAKALYAHTHGGKKLGLAEAVEAQGLAWTGTHHRGIDDARNVARLLQVLLT